MAVLKYDKEITALLLIDPYNDFISDGGKVWNRLKTRLGSTLRPSRRQRGCTKGSKTAREVARSAASSSLNRAKS
jgi:hypothetical protein